LIPADVILLSPGQFAAVCLIVMVGAFVQGSVGFGLNMIAAPLLLLIDPVLVPGPSLGLALCANLLISHRERRSIDMPAVAWALPGRVVGTVVAAWILVTFHGLVYEFLFAPLVLLAVVMSIGGVRPRPTQGNLLIAGTLSGFMGTVSSIGGPPIALVHQDSEGARFRGTLAPFFVFGTVLSIATLYAIGEYGTREIWATLALLPALVVGFLASRHGAAVLDRGFTRHAVLSLSAISAVAVLLKAML